MDRWQQYAVAAFGLLGFAGLGYVGFVLTGGAVPYKKKFHGVIEGAAPSGGGGLVQTGRDGVFGVVLAGPLRDQVGAFLAVLLALVVVAVGLYWYAGRRDRTRPERPSH